MRRVISMAMVAAFLTAPLAPVWAAGQCSSVGQSMACHRMVKIEPGARHCDGMPEHHHNSAPASQGMVIASSGQESCPMNCCVQGRVQSGIAAAPISIPVPMAVTDKEFSYAPVMFTSAGFSSHTDRGPPPTQSLA